MFKVGDLVSFDATSSGKIYVCFGLVVRKIPNTCVVKWLDEQGHKLPLTAMVDKLLRKLS